MSNDYLTSVHCNVKIERLKNKSEQNKQRTEPNEVKKIIYTVLSICCPFRLAWVPIAGLKRCASHGSIIQSRGWLPIVEALRHSRDATSTKQCSC